jgi:hypothetical protein
MNKKSDRLILQHQTKVVRADEWIESPLNPGFAISPYLKFDHPCLTIGISGDLGHGFDHAKYRLLVKDYNGIFAPAHQNWSPTLAVLNFEDSDVTTATIPCNSLELTAEITFKHREPSTSTTPLDPKFDTSNSETYAGQMSNWMSSKQKRSTINLSRFDEAVIEVDRSLHLNAPDHDWVVVATNLNVFRTVDGVSGVLFIPW